MGVRIISFSFRDRDCPQDATLVVDCRRLPNPHKYPHLSKLTGKDPRVQEFLSGVTGEAAWLSKQTADVVANAAGKDHVIAFGCVGGRHRSVAMAEMLGAGLRAQGLPVEIEHLSLVA